MNNFKRITKLFVVASLFFSMGFITSCQPEHSQIAKDQVWPEVKSEMKPWTRWWWMGSAIDEENLSRLLEDYASKGFGGVEIAPIYGAKGYEDRYVEYLSPRWIELLNHTVAKADSLSMGVDMTTGTGWPFGGPNITPEYAASRLFLKKYSLAAGEKIDEPIKLDDRKQNQLGPEIVAITAYGSDGKIVDVLEHLTEDQELNWSPENGNWDVYVAFDGFTRQQVKRAAPGGEGYTFDHLSEEALTHYLKRFDEAFGEDVPDIRCFFNDSYELFSASWSNDFLEAFEARQGYSLKNYIRELNGDGDEETIARVKSDYRETMSDMLIDNFSSTWTEWANNKGARTRNQSHGSPANLLDVYASVDNPEIETFGASSFDVPGLFRDTAHIKKADHNPLFLKMAASAANLSGKELVSCETFTWLGEHFRVPLSQTKPEAEQAWLSGVNHIFYHGTTYSPDDADWPGWLFYASVNFAPTNSFWTHIQGMNDYITRSQSILQTTTADNDVLVYWPIYDTWHNAEGMEKMMAVHGSDEWLNFPQIERLMERGYSFDFVSDSLLKTLETRDEMLLTANLKNQYKAIIVPETRFMPLATLKTLQKLAEKGVPVIFEELPEDVPGVPNLEERRSEMKDILASTSSQFLITDDFEQALIQSSISRETLADTGLKFLRKKSRHGTYYFLVNHTSGVVDKTIHVNGIGENVLLQDPQTGEFGKVTSVSEDEKTGFRVQIEPGESLFALVTDDELQDIADWGYETKVGEAVTVDGEWELEFLEGGPELPDDYVMQELKPWTEAGNEAMNRFSGTARYSTKFNFEQKNYDDYILDLGKVLHSARVIINGHDLGILWSVPFKVNIGSYLQEGENELIIEVANLMANRIRDLDLRGVEWQIFHEINFVNIQYRDFDASDWEVMPSGLEGPVTIQPVKKAESSPSVLLEQKGEEGLTFDFGSGETSPETIQVKPSLAYSAGAGYGFDFWTSTREKKSQSENLLTDDACTSDEPFYFSVDLPEGNYEVTVSLGNPDEESVNFVKAESRRLMVEKSVVPAGEMKQHTFMVNVRTPYFGENDSIRRKSREYTYLNWDNKLTLEFNGENPSVYGVNIKKAPEDMTTVYLAGNSTVVDQDLEPYASWGQMITNFFDNDVVVANYAESGESLASFKGARRLEKVLHLMEEGDYLFIEFGHNDQKRKGEGIGPWESFTGYLNEFVDRTLEKGGKPVLVTPMHRRNFNDRGKIVATHGEYPDAIREVAQDKDVPLIDLNKMSKTLYESWGPEDSKKAFVHYPAGTFDGQENKLADDTHFNNYGAYVIALCLIKGIRANKLELASHIEQGVPEIDLENPMLFAELEVPHSPRSKLKKT